MNVLKKIENMARIFPNNLALNSRYGQITYEELWRKSGVLANWIYQNAGDKRHPIPVYGHKSPEMFVCFLACVKAGRAYCPIDISMSEDRIRDIISMTESDIVLAVEELDYENCKVVSKKEILEFSGEGREIGSEHWVNADDDFYIIFTSGSTGRPKGVRITASNLNNFTDWMKNLGGEKSADKVFMNQAPFSFDLSVMDVYTSLTNGCNLLCVDKELQQDVSETIDYIRDGKVAYWVSTPSFADMCLADKNFNEEYVGKIEIFLFCGEKLGVRTAKGLREKFPSAKIVNTYGPTESTVAVTGVEITDEMLLSGKELPIGMEKPGSRLYIINEQGEILSAGAKGEIIIAGDTVSPGYFRNEEKTNEVFISGDKLGEASRAYKTGDEGFVGDDGLLYYSGRIDLQVKFHGYRIELGDIEQNMRTIGEISSVCVLPKYADDRIRYLVAFVVAPKLEGCYGDRKMIKESLKQKLPDYMVPKKIVFIKAMPLTNNGKTDRKKLEAEL